MLRWCSYCQKFLQEVEPYSDFSLTHTICTRCKANKAHTDKAAITDAKKISAFYREIFEAAETGHVLVPKVIFQEALALGIDPLDFVMGMVQPVLYQIGDWYSKGKITVSKEHVFTAFASHVIELALGQYKAEGLNKGGQPLDVLLTCADGNFHTIGVRIMDLAMRQEGFRCLSVVPSLPVREVIDMVKDYRPKFVGMSVALVEQFASVEEMVAGMKDIPKSKRPRIVVGGNFVRSHLNASKTLPSSVTILTDVSEFVRLVHQAKQKPAA